MYPYLLPEIFGYTIIMYDMLIIIGLILMMIYVGYRFEKREKFTRKQTNKLLVLIGISLIATLVSAFVFDMITHSIAEGELTFGSISFLGGLIGGIGALLLLIKYFYKEPNKDVKKIMNVVITGVVLAHAFGRIGCFLAGCCYGIPTESFIGVVFPYGHAHDAFPDTAIIPTQLLESAFLFMLFVVLDRVKKLRGHEVETYLLGYGVWRICIEFFRGDNRGSFFTFIHTAYYDYPSPSQYMSLIMVALGIYMIIKQVNSKRKLNV